MLFIKNDVGIKTDLSDAQDGYTILELLVVMLIVFILLFLLVWLKGS